MLAAARALPSPPDFDTAWTTALKRVKWPRPTNHRRQWTVAFADPIIVQEWRRAYVGEPSTLAALADLESFGPGLISLGPRRGSMVAAPSQVR